MSAALYRTSLLTALVVTIGCHGAPDEPPLPPLPPPAESAPLVVPTHPHQYLLASPSGVLATWSDGGHILFWDDQSAQPQVRSSNVAPNHLLTSRLSPLGDRLFIVASAPDYGIHLIEIDAETGEQIGPLSVPGDAQTADDIVATSVGRDGRFCLVTPGGLYSFTRSIDGPRWHLEGPVSAVDGQIELGPGCDRAVVWDDGGACIVGPEDAMTCPSQLGEPFDPTAFAPAWTDYPLGQSTTIAAELGGQMLRWDTGSGDYSEIAPAGLAPIDSRPFLGVGGGESGAVMFLWTNHVVTVWRGAERSEWTWPADLPLSAMLAIDGSDFWILRSDCTLRYLDPSTGERLRERQICLP